MKPGHPHTSRRAHSELLREIFVLERSGKFDRALQELRGVWDDTTENPQVRDLDPRMTAETYLRCGALIGFLGHCRQIPTAQERSKNLLTEARCLFLEICDPTKIAECENYLALAYWRTGESNEAMNWIEEALAHDLPTKSDARLCSYMVRDLVLLSQRKYAQVCSNFTVVERLFDADSDSFLTGSVYNNFGLAAKNLGNTAAALFALEKARNLFTSSGNTLQMALAENNLSQLYKAEGRFDLAHSAVDRSITLYREIKDRTREGFTWDTKALIYFDQGHFTEALKTVDVAISILGKSENFAYLAETLGTKARIQLYTDDFSTATMTLLEAVDIAKIRIGEEFATNLVREFEQSLKKVGDRSGKARVKGTEPIGSASSELKLVLPPPISQYENYQGVWINNSDLENHGLVRGALAVVVPCRVERGDLVALVEIETDLVSCGFYDADFGIVCLEAGTAEPQLFSEADVKILGKIVGVCDAKDARDGAMKVRAIEL
jgi:tetratricopeptide (TPR) repeat protein